jgi:Flp pilus assembly protein TadG
MNTRNQKFISAPRRRQRGISMVEFVVAAPVVLFIALCIAEMGFALLQYNNINKSLRDGARHLANTAIPSGATINLTQDVRDEVANLVAYGTLTSSDTSKPVAPGLAPGDVTIVQVDDDDLRVEVSHVYEPVLLGGIAEVYTRDGGTINNALTMQAQIFVRALSSDG